MLAPSKPNERQNYHRKQMIPRTKIQHLMKFIEHDKYVYWLAQLDNEDVIKDILWTNSNSIKLLNSFPIVLICDTTYKTNKYCLLLLKIVGIAPTSMTFVVALAYLSYERTYNFEWALSKLEGLLVKDNVLPLVIVGDRILLS